MWDCTGMAVLMSRWARANGALIHVQDLIQEAELAWLTHQAKYQEGRGTLDNYRRVVCRSAMRTLTRHEIVRSREFPIKTEHETNIDASMIAALMRAVTNPHDRATVTAKMVGDLKGSGSSAPQWINGRTISNARASQRWCRALRQMKVWVARNDLSIDDFLCE